MKFSESEVPVTPFQLDYCEKQYDFRLPESLRRNYLNSNGGIPENDLFSHEEIGSTLVSFTPILAVRGEEFTSLESYQILALEEKSVPTSFFPFATGSDGDYFLVDTSTPDGQVHFYCIEWDDPFVDLKMNIDEFWASLKQREEAEGEEG